MLSTIEDSRWARGALSKTLVHYSEHDLGHRSYFKAKDMSYFTEEVMGLVRRYHSHKTEAVLE